MQVGLDVTGGNNFVDLGSTPLASVPYAIHSRQTDGWKNNDPIIQKGDLNVGATLPPVGEGSRLIWYPRKSAFLAGYNDSNTWQDNNIGQVSATFGLGSMAKASYSMATGIFTTALGDGAISAGYYSEAKGNNSFSMGYKALAKGDNSIAFGDSSVSNGTGSVALGSKTLAIGDASIAVGAGLESKAFGSAAFGTYNNVQDNPVGSKQPQAHATDRIFQIGNGSGSKGLSNALTVLRNGNIGVGNGALSPQYILDIAGRPRIRHTNVTAGLFFDDTNNAPTGFVGMKNDNEVGFYIGNAWQFWVDGSGVSTFASDFKLASDRRLKRDFSDLRNSLDKISLLKGQHYYWKDNNRPSVLQTGLIAQEIEKVFPELVATGRDGYKSVNYIGLIPHLIESIKSLKQENEELRKALSRISELEASIEKLVNSGK